MTTGLAFTYSLDVAKLVGPAGAATAALQKLNDALRAADRATQGSGYARASEGAARFAAAQDKAAAASRRAADDSGRSARKIADEWQKMAERAERAEVRRTSVLAREAARQAQIEERKASATEKSEARAAAAVEKAAARKKSAADKAALASSRAMYGGKESFGALLASTAQNKISGLASSAASAIVSAPLSIASGIGSGILGVFDLATSAASAGVSLAFSFAKMAVSAQAMRESSVEGFAAIYGSSEIGNKLFDEARKAAKQTKFDTKEVVRDYNTIAAAGFGASQISRIYWTSADIGSARGAGNQSRYLTALAKINASPQAAFGAVQQAALAGPGIGNVFDSLGDKLGLKQTLTRKGWMAKFRSGEISGQVALESVIDATNKLYNRKTGQVGEYARGQGDKTWSGALSNIANGLGDVLNGQLLDSNPINKFKTLLQSIGSSGGLFDETSKRGQRFANLISNVVADIFAPFGGITLENTNSLMDKLLTAAEALEKRFRSFMGGIGSSFSEILARSEDTLTQMATRIATAALVGIGKAAVMGVGNAAVAGVNWLGSDNEGMDAETRIASAPKMASGGIVPGPPGSPQLIMAHGGEIIPGLNGEHMDDAMRAYGGGSGGGNTYNISVTTGSGADGGDIASAIVSALRNEVRSPSARSA